MITVAFTGHRPVKLFFGYDESAPACSRIKEQLEKLSQLNCDSIQGYVFSGPTTEMDVLLLL